MTFLTGPLGSHQENKGRRAPQVSQIFAVETPLRKVRRIRFCWPFSIGRLTEVIPTSITISMESPNCPTPPQRKLPPLTGKPEKFELFEDLFQKIHSQLTEGDKIKYFHSLMRGDKLQTFKNITSLNREILEEILTVVRWKNLKPQSKATDELKFQRLVFNPANQKLIDFLDELQKLAKDASRVAAQAINEEFIHAKMPPRLRKSINQAHLENSKFEQIVSHLKREFELNGLEDPDEQQINTVVQEATQQYPGKSKPTFQHCRKPGHYRNQCHRLRRENYLAQNNTNRAGSQNNKMVVKQNLTPSTRLPTTPKQKVQISKLIENHELSTHPVRRVVKPTVTQRIATLEQTQLTDRVPGKDHRKDRLRLHKETLKKIRM